MTTLPDFDAATFSDSTAVTNPLFPLPGGLINSYSAEILDTESGEIEMERNDHFATYETRTISGVESVVVRDTAFEDEMLVEDTLDWFAQDDAGNVWYMGEIAINYNYDDDGAFLGTDFDGSWEAGVDGALPGWLMKTIPVTGDSYFQEFYEGEAEDEGEVLATGLTVETEYGTFTDVVRIRDSSVLEPDSIADKFFAPGIGMVKEDEFDLSESEEPELVIELENIRSVDKAGTVDPSRLAFAGSGSAKTVTFLSEDSEDNGAIGAYVFDPVTGEIGEGRILFADTEDARAGDSVSMTVPDGMSLGLFMVADEDNVGVELEDYETGGLFFGNVLAGNPEAAYDGDPGTRFIPGVATIFDGIAPVVTDSDGYILPIRPLHAVGNHGGANFLNQAAGMNARVDAAGEGVAGVTVVGFEEEPASSLDYESDDFNDALVAVSDGSLSKSALDTLLDRIDISRIVGTDGDDILRGTGKDDQIIGLEGDDRIAASNGDDIVEASDGDDFVRGGSGDDVLEGEDGDDRLHGGTGDDEIDGGDGDDRLAGGRGDDELDGDDGDDVIKGIKGDDLLIGDEGDDRLLGGQGDDRLLGGEDDDLLNGGAGADTFVFDLTALGHDTITDFELGTDRIEVATYLDVESIGDLAMHQDGDNTVIDLAEGSITLRDTAMSSLAESDFAFV